MMIQTKKMGLKKPQVSDQVDQTIAWLADNFQVIDNHFEELISDAATHPEMGEFFHAGKKFWNKNASRGDFAGWVNVREGVFAPSWQKQYSYAAGNKVKASPDNGHYYECIIGGTSGMKQPTFPTTSGSLVYDLYGHTAWKPSYHYKLDEIVVATNGDMSYYYKCIIEGASDSVEPAWGNISGSTIVDGSVHWYVYKTVQWKEMGASCEFVPFGTIGNYKGEATIETVGTLKKGKWEADTVELAHGGTGATDADGARRNLGATGKYSKTLGDGLSTTYTIKHQLNTQDVVVMVREAESPFAAVDAQINMMDENSVILTFPSVPAVNQYRVTVIG